MKDLISKLLTVSPKERITADEALHHPWVVVRLSLSLSPSCSLMAHTTDGLQRNERKRKREEEEGQGQEEANGAEAEEEEKEAEPEPRHTPKKRRT